MYASPVFDRMLKSEFKEKQNNIVTLKGKNFDVFKEMLLHMHPGIRKPITGNLPRPWAETMIRLKWDNLTVYYHDYQSVPRGRVSRGMTLSLTAVSLKVQTPLTLGHLTKSNLLAEC